MARTATPWPTAAERQLVQEIIDRHYEDRPDGVLRVTPTFGEDHAGDPAVYLKIMVSKSVQPTKKKIEELNDFVQVLLRDIINSDIEYWPYSRTLVEE